MRGERRKERGGEEERRREREEETRETHTNHSTLDPHVHASSD